MRNKKQLYNNIMADVAKIVKQKLNENNQDSDNILATVDTLDFGLCTIKPAFDPDEGDFYEVYDENDEFVCEIPYSTNLNDEEEILSEIDYALESEYPTDEEWN